MKRIRMILALGVLVSVSAMLLQAQSYEIKSSVIGGGGGVSTGGVYSVSGTVGQPAVGQMSGGQYTLNGGFWAVVAIQSTNAPYLYVNQSGSSVVVYWTDPSGAFKLKQTQVLAVPIESTVWGDVTNAVVVTNGVSTVTFPSPNGNRYVRLQK